MEQNKLTQEQKDILSQLYDKDQTIVINTIRSLRDKGGVFIVEALIDTYFTTNDDTIKKEILDLFIDIKDQSISHIIVSKLNKYRNSDSLHNFLSILWQSSLQFDNLDIFVDLFINANDLVALESITILEQNIVNTTKEQQSEFKRKILDAQDDFSEFKRTLCSGIIDLINS